MAAQDYAAYHNYYISYTDGDDGFSGTMAKPFRTIEFARGWARAGDTIYLRDGIHLVENNLTFKPGKTTNGTEQQPITLKGYPNELAIVDGQGTDRIFQLHDGTRWWRFEDIQVRNAVSQCFELAGVEDIVFTNVVASNSTAPFAVYLSKQIRFDSCEAYAFSANGFAIKENSEDITFFNCTAHDSELGGNYDGWEVTNTCRRTELQSCTAYNCSDAGFDLSSETRVIGCVARDCGAGFKLWDSRKVNPQGEHFLYRCVAYKCLEYGILLSVRHSSSHGGGGGDNRADIQHCTIADCKINIWIGTSSDEGYRSTVKIRNTISSHAADQGKRGTIRALYVEDPSAGELQSKIQEEHHNCWHRMDGEEVIHYQDYDFTMDQVNDGIWILANNEDGLGEGTFSLDPLFIDFVGRDFHLTPGSPCIDTGVDLGYEYFGDAPDLGAFESP